MGVVLLCSNIGNSCKFPSEELLERSLIRHDQYHHIHTFLTSLKLYHLYFCHPLSAFLELIWLYKYVHCSIAHISTTSSCQLPFSNPHISIAPTTSSLTHTRLHHHSPPLTMDVQIYQMITKALTDLGITHGLPKERDLCPQPPLWVLFDSMTEKTSHIRSALKVWDFEKSNADQDHMALDHVEWLLVPSSIMRGFSPRERHVLLAQRWESGSSSFLGYVMGESSSLILFSTPNPNPILEGIELN